MTGLHPTQVRRAGSRSGFTQIELLVSLVIIILLASMLVPMIGRTRESARSSQCKDHLHNLAIACQGHVSRSGEFPAGVLGTTGPVRSEPGGDGLSWLVQMLPFTEQNPLHSLVDYDSGVDHQSPQVREAHVSVFRCSSDRLAIEPQPAASNYAGCHHHVETPIDSENHGSFVAGRGLRPIDFLDGFSHTVMIGEKEIPVDDRGWLSGSRATLRNAGTPLTRLVSSEVRTRSPEHDPLAVGSFHSAHVDGVHFALADGSVRMLAWATDLATLRKLVDRADGGLIHTFQQPPSRAALSSPNSTPAP